MNALARICSFLFHPLLMATYLFVIVGLSLPSALLPLQGHSLRVFILMIFILTFMLPILNIGIFRAFGNISSIMMVNRRERLIPFLLITIIYVIVTWLLYSKMRIALNENSFRLLVIIDLMVVVSTVVTFFFKISVHSVGIWGMVGMTLLLTKISEVNTLFYVSLGLIVLAGLIMSSRLQLGAHTYREVMWGGIVGLACSITGMLILF